MESMEGVEDAPVINIHRSSRPQRRTVAKAAPMRWHVAPKNKKSNSGKANYLNRLQGRGLEFKGYSGIGGHGGGFIGGAYLVCERRQRYY